MKDKNIYDNSKKKLMTLILWFMVKKLHQQWQV